ncbi:hypothetical protein ACFYOT_23340 [Saccharothrix saharensis]|uniref:hypothetical protein n=1 Tax=Saccharothrix saharensis TaxID=571190 RepID=UPI00368E462A
MSEESEAENQADQNAVASGNSTIHQAGRDLFHITGGDVHVHSSSVEAPRPSHPEVSMGVPATGPQVGGLPQLSVQGTETPLGVLRQTPPTIDVRLVNNGAGTAVITGCEVHVLWARRFPTLLPPEVEVDRSGAALLPPSAHYVALLPGPEDSVGLTVGGSRDRPVIPRDPEGLSPAHDLAPGASDRFIIRLETEPHGGGTLFDHAMPWDDQFVYIVRLTLRYAGGPETREISTGEIAVGFPANTFVIHSPDEIVRYLREFRQEVERTRRDVDAGRLGAGTELTAAFFDPDRAAREFVARCDAFYGLVMAEMYPGTDDTRHIRELAGRYREELRRNPGRYR